MIQMESKVVIADNTGARQAKMIGVLGTRSKAASIGDIITAHVREAIPTASVKKGAVIKAVVVRTAYPVLVLMVPFFVSMRMQSSLSIRTITQRAPASSDQSPVNFVKRIS